MNEINKKKSDNDLFVKVLKVNKCVNVSLYVFKIVVVNIYDNKPPLSILILCYSSSSDSSRFRLFTNP